MDPTAENSPRVIPTLKNLSKALVGTMANRLELAAGEAREELERWLESLLLAAALVTLGALTLGVITVTIVVTCWETHKLAALGILSGLYLCGTVAVALRLRWRLQNWAPFEGTLGELQKDKAWLSEQDKPTGDSANKP